MNRPTHVAACQFEPDIGDIHSNYDSIAEITAALDEKVSCAIFPELCVTGYDLDAAEEFATSIPGENTEPLVEIASEQNLSLAIGIPERDGSSLFNTLTFIDPAGVQAVYRKQYLWGEEANTFDSGSQPVTIETDFGKVGFVLCYDLNFPEAALAYGRAECDILAVSAAWRSSYRDNWRVLLRSRALDGTCYTVGSNHTGEQNGRQHGGDSLVADPCGVIVDNAETARSSASTAIEERRLQKCRQRNPVAAYRNQNQ